MHQECAYNALKLCLWRELTRFWKTANECYAYNLCFVFLLTWNQEAGSESLHQHQWLSETATLLPSEGSEVCRECWEGRRLSSTKRLGWGEWHRAPELKSKQTEQKYNQKLLSDASQTSVRPLLLSVGGNTQTSGVIRLNSGMMAYNYHHKFFPSVNTCLFCRLSHLAFLFSALLRGRAFPFWLRCRGVKRFNLQEKTTMDI